MDECKNAPAELNNIIKDNMKKELMELHVKRVFHEAKIQYLENLNIRLNNINMELKNKIDNFSKHPNI